MFEIIYLFVLALAALPLARTFMRGARGNHRAFVHRLYRDAAYILAAVVGVVICEAALGISLENYWFAELGQSHRYWLSLEYRVAIFLAVLLLVGLFVGANLRLLARPYAIVPTSAPWMAGFVFAAMAGFLATSLWIPLMRFLGATPAGVVDPVFGQRSFFLFVGIAPLRRHRRNNRPDLLRRDRALGRAWNGGAQRNGRVCLSARSIRRLLPAPERRRSKSQSGGVGELAAARHGSRRPVVRRLRRQPVLGPVSPRSERTFKGRSRRVLCRRQFLVARIRPHRRMLVRGRVDPRSGGRQIPGIRNWLLMRQSHWLAPLATLAVLFVGAYAVPTSIEDFYVGPNQITLELPYLLSSIAGTRQAYNLEGPSVAEREFAVSATPLTAAELTKNSATLQDARIWDWRALEPQLQQIQGLRPYCTFHGVDIDRYVIDGAVRQVIITARELNVTGFRPRPRFGSISRSNTPTVTVSLRSQ